MHHITQFWDFLVRKVGFLGALVLVTLSFVLLYLGFSFMSDSNGAVEETPVTTTVRAVSLFTISANGDGTAVPTADGNAFIVRAESGGRVERVANVGDTVARGAIVAQLENSAQRAAVLQAQGAYEAAKASARVSDVGSVSADRAYDEALTQAQNTVRGAFSTADNILRNTVDKVYSQPNTTIPGLKISGTGRALELTRERVAIETLYEAWLPKTTASNAEDAVSLLELAQTNVARLTTLVTTLTSALADDDALDDAAALTTLRTEFASARTTLNGVLQNLSGARSTLIAAQTAKEQAAIAGGGSDISLADAQVKQALGVLESARAALSKTSVKTPVAGTVTAVNISVGDIINTGSDVVFVASDATSEKTGDTVTVPLTSVKFTPSKAFIFTVLDGTVVAHEVKTGSVTTNSITITGAAGITDIVLDVRGLKEGDAVVVQ